MAEEHAMKSGANASSFLNATTEHRIQEPTPSPEKSVRRLPLRACKTDAGGRLRLSDFRILLRLESGNMGVVYLAHQISADRNVAIKVLPRRLASNPACAERFTREAAVMATLHHPGLVGFIGACEESGSQFLVMEFVEGASTATLLQLVGGRFAVGDALHIVLRCAEALDYAHRHHVVHRDVTPTNIPAPRTGAVT